MTQYFPTDKWKTITLLCILLPSPSFERKLDHWLADTTEWEVGVRNADWQISGNTPYTCVYPVLRHWIGADRSCKIPSCWYVIPFCTSRIRDKCPYAEEPLLGLHHDNGVRRLRVSTPGDDPPSHTAGPGSPERHLENRKHIQHIQWEMILVINSQLLEVKRKQMALSKRESTEVGCFFFFYHRSHKRVARWLRP